METTSTSPLPSDPLSTSQKRKRSPSIEPPTLSSHPSKVPKTSSSSSHLSINYLARQYTDTLPLISTDDTLPNLLSLVADYDGVLQRHESMAGNLGARPLGPILIQRFDRLFDGPPKVLKASGKEGTTVGWLDVVDFARNKPQQFNLEKMRDGIRVCQFFTKQCRVEISEEDYLLISSGIPQKMIPPQPIEEDEEKELGTLEILEKNLGAVVQAADQVSAKARQLNHRLKNRKVAIISRRESEKTEATGTDDRIPSPIYQPNGEQRKSISPTSGFVAVNSKSQQPNGLLTRIEPPVSENPRPASIPTMNGYTSQGASAATRAELLSKFHTSSERLSLSNSDRRSSISSVRPTIPPKSRSKPSADQMDYAGFLNAAASPVPIPNTPSSLLPYVKPTAAERFDDSGPYKADMMLRMEQLNRGDRVQPPCDRCRRLQMDCLKNLTACMGCTRKHAKCSWKDVEEQELRDHPFIPRVLLEAGEKGSGDEDGKGKAKKDWSKDGVQGVRDEELLGEESEEDEGGADGGPNENDRRFEAKSHSPATNTTMNGLNEPRQGVNSAPPSTMQSPPVRPQQSTKPPPPDSSVMSSFSSVNRKPDIPLYHPPTIDSPPAVRSFTAQEWDSHTRYSPTATRATPSSDIHDELKSAALAAEKSFDRRDNMERDPVRIYTASSDPSNTVIDLDDTKAPTSPIISSKTAHRGNEGTAAGQPTPPPESSTERKNNDDEECMLQLKRYESAHHLQQQQQREKDLKVLSSPTSLPSLAAINSAAPTISTTKESVDLSVEDADAPSLPTEHSKSSPRPDDRPSEHHRSGISNSALTPKVERH